MFNSIMIDDWNVQFDSRKVIQYEKNFAEIKNEVTNERTSEREN